MKDLNTIQDTVDQLKSKLIKSAKVIKGNNLRVHKLVKDSGAFFNSSINTDEITNYLIDNIYNLAIDDIIKAINEASVSVEIK